MPLNACRGGSSIAGFSRPHVCCPSSKYEQKSTAWGTRHPVSVQRCFPIVPSPRPVWPSVAGVDCARHQISKVYAETCFSKPKSTAWGIRHPQSLQRCFPIVLTPEPVWPFVAGVHCAGHQTSNLFLHCANTEGSVATRYWLQPENMEAQHHGLQR